MLCHSPAVQGLPPWIYGNVLGCPPQINATVHLQSVETSLMKRQPVDVIITDRRVITMTSVDNCALSDNEEYCNYSKSGHSIIIAHLWRRRLGTACPWEPHTWDELASGRHNGWYWWCSAGPSCCWHFFSHSQCGLLISIRCALSILPQQSTR